jgi:hypothetical protein
MQVGQGEPKTISITKKHSGRMTVVLGVSALGKKHLILFIIGGSKMGKIAKEEMKMYLQQHYYMCQEKA